MEQSIYKNHLQFCKEKGLDPQEELEKAQSILDNEFKANMDISDEPELVDDGIPEMIRKNSNAEHEQHVKYMINRREEAKNELQELEKMRRKTVKKQKFVKQIKSKEYEFLSLSYKI